MPAAARRAPLCSVAHGAPPQEPAFPQLLSDPPSAPAEDIEVTDDHHKYAAFFIALLVSSVELDGMQEAHPQASLWELFVLWRDRAAVSDADADVIATTVMRNINDDYTRAKNRNQKQ